LTPGSESTRARARARLRARLLLTTARAPPAPLPRSMVPADKPASALALLNTMIHDGAW
jgi:hypothetical protein